MKVYNITNVTEQCILLILTLTFWQVLNVIGNEGTQHIEGSETLVVMNQLADRIQEEFIAIGEGEDQGEAISQGQEQREVQHEDDGIAVGGEEIIGNQQVMFFHYCPHERILTEK